MGIFITFATLMKTAKYKEYRQLDLVKAADEQLTFWQDSAIFQKSISSRSDKKNFTFYEGPPSANGLPGIHHVMGRAIKDIFCRYKTLKGYTVERKGGWDTHGLPIELAVEKTLGITKDDIGTKISIEEYNVACRKEVMKYKNVWDDLTVKMGYWVDLENPYITFDNHYIESVWHLLKQLYDKDLLYKGYTIQPYSPAAGTGLSSHELNMPGTYRDVKDTSVVAQFKVVHNARSEKLFSSLSSDVYFLAWTTTPWTLPANCALAIGEHISYSLIETYNPYTFKKQCIVLASDLISRFFSEEQSQLPMNEYVEGQKKIPYKTISTLKGNDLKGIQYEQLLPYVQPNGKAFEVIAGDFVTTEDGTGIVHTASVFGADDFRVCNENGIQSIMVKDADGNDVPLVNKQGRFVKEVTDFANEPVKEEYLTDTEKEEARLAQGRDKYLTVDERIAIKLKQENKAFKVERYEHSYPHCWRTDKPILYYPLDSWFVRTTSLRQRMIELNNTINWKPKSTGTGRFGNWLENLVDWNLSRSRFWGIPLPIWVSEDRSEMICIGSVIELNAQIEKSIAAGVMKKNPIEKEDKLSDLHKPFIDEIILISDSGKPLYRESDLIDVWFDSGAMPYAQWHYPFENVEQFKNSFPADFIAEGVDQTRGWFFTLHAIAVMLFDSVAFKNVVSNGLVLDKNGNKMSKRLGNAVDPFYILKTYGPDATRWYMISNAQPWDNLRFNEEGITEVQRKFFGTLYNTYSFFALYANLDSYSVDEPSQSDEDQSELDRWIISLLNSLIKEVDSAYADYEPTRAARLLQDFVCDHLSNWYVRLSRRRFWKGEYSDDKKAAYHTLYTCLTEVSKMMSPIAPFFSDQLYRDLTHHQSTQKFESVHLSDFPMYDDSKVDRELEERMELAQTISSMVLSLRKKANLRVRQPLRKILIPVLNEQLSDEIKKVQDLILSEVNVKEILFVTNTDGLVVKKLKLNFKVLGPRVGSNMKQLTNLATTLTQNQINEYEQKGTLKINENDFSFELLNGDAEILSEDIPGWQVATQGKLTVALDTELSDELRQEGIARELVNRIQNIRKEKGFEVTDRISVKLTNNDLLRRSVTSNFDYICNEILASSLELVDQLEPQDAIEIVLEEELTTLTSVNKY